MDWFNRQSNAAKIVIVAAAVLILVNLCAALGTALGLLAAGPPPG